MVPSRPSLLFPILVGMLCAQSKAIATVESRFEKSDESWTIHGDAQGSSVTPDYSSTGGNPDGHIWAVDDAVGGVWYFNAPAKFLGNQTAAYNQPISFDLKQTYPGGTTPFDVWQGILRPDVALIGPGGLTIAYNFFSHPLVNIWTPYTIVIHESAGWRNQDTGNPATQSEILAVLGNLQSLRIRGEYRVGSDTGFLDNVVLVRPTCPPDIAPPGGDGIVNANDLLAVINGWGTCTDPKNCPADVTQDGVVNANDLLAVINGWGACP